MPPDAMRWSISKMPFRRVPGARRDRSAEYMSVICPYSASLPTSVPPPCLPRGEGNEAGRGDGLSCGWIESHRNDGDIVDRPAIERHVDQEIAGFLGRVCACKPQYLLVLNMGCEAVRADHEDVPRLQGAAFDLELWIIAHADRPCYDVSTWPGARLLRSEPALGNEFLHFRMIDRYLLDPVVTNTVDSAVSGPYGGVMAIENKQNCDRGADQRAALIAELFKAAVGADDAPLAVCQQLGRCSGNRHSGEFLDDGSACNVACLMAAHAVGDGPQAEPCRHQIIVFVLPPHLADVRCGAGLDP